jgi:hypothetical protein
MKAHVGRCRLCLNTRELTNSHLMPASVYKLVRDSSGGANPNPVAVSRKHSFLTSKQVSAHFLCGDCEQRFHEDGEDYVVPHCAQLNGRCKLREVLQAASPLYSLPQGNAYDVQPLLGNKIEQYLYFAASIFWRASAHRWKMGREWLDQIALGPTYQEQFRLYRLGKAAIPQNARIWVCVSNEGQLHRMIAVPYTTKIDELRRHDFYIPGIHFILFLGQRAPQECDAGALNGSLQQMMWLYPWRDDPVFLGSVSLIKASAPSGRLRR